MLLPLNFNIQTEYEGTSDCLNTRLVVNVESKLHIKLSPHVVEDLLSFAKRCQTYYLIRDLKQYRPHRKPITDSQIPHKFIKNKILKHKRRLVVRDWFFYILWSIRLKNIMKNINSKPVLDSYLLFDPKYAKLLKMCLDEGVSFEKVR